MFTKGEKIALAISGLEIVGCLGIAMACYKKACSMVQEIRDSKKSKN